MEKKSNVVSMKSGKKSESKDNKLSYEDLERVAIDLNNQCSKLYEQLQNAKRTIAEFNEIGLLLGIVSKGEYFSNSFVDRCTEKIEHLVNSALDASDKAEKEFSASKVQSEQPEKVEQ